MRNKIGRRPAVVLGLAMAVLAVGMFVAAANSPRLSSFLDAKLVVPPNEQTASVPEFKADAGSVLHPDPAVPDERRLDPSFEAKSPSRLVENEEHSGEAAHRDAKGRSVGHSKEKRADADADNEDGKKESAEEYEQLLEQEAFWHTRLTYPTGRFDPAWLRHAVEQDSQIERGVPAGSRQAAADRQASPLTLDPNSFTPLGPKPERMTGCAGCYDYGVTQGRVNAIAADPTTTTPGSIVAYIATVGGGVAKTSTCCSAATTWTLVTDDPLVSTTGVDTLAIDPNDHNVVYAGTGDLNFGSFSMGSQGVLKTTDAGATWTTLGASVFGAAYTEPAGQFPQYDAIGKVRVDPNNSNRIVAGTKKGLFLSYNGGVDWTGPCLTNSFPTQRQDTTGLELSNMGGGVTRIIAAVGSRGFATAVQYDLGANGANGLYKGTIPASGCPGDFSLVSRNDNGFVFGPAVSGSIYPAGANMNAGSGNPFVDSATGEQLGRIDIAVAPSNPNYIYAQISSIAINDSCGASGCQLGVWWTIDGGTTWTFMAGSAGASLRDCTSTGTAGAGSDVAGSGDYNQNWYDQGLAVDPNNPDRIFMDTYDTWLGIRTGTNFYNVTCGYSSTSLSAHAVHVDHHGLAFVPGLSNILLEGSDGGIFSTSNANAAADGTLRPTWANMDTGLNTIEFYSGDISGSFATSATPYAVGGAQDNGPSSAVFAGSPTGGVQWQMGTGGDGFSGQIDPMGTGTNLRLWEGNNSGGLSRCTSNCANAGASWVSSRGAWTSDTQAFMLPINLFRGGIPGGDDCAPAGATTGCGHLIAGTTRVWETILGAGASVPSSAWHSTNSTACTATSPCLTKGTLADRSYITQVKYSPKFQSVAIVGTNDGNVQIGFNMGAATANQGNWVNVTGSNASLPNRPILGIALDPSVPAANVPVGYATVGGFNANTPTTPGHLFQVSCTALCATFTWLNKTGNLPDIPADSVIVNPNFPQQVFVGTDFGLYFTNDITAATPQWSRFTSGLPAVMIWDMQIDRGSTTLSLWTRARGAFVWPLPAGPVGGTPTPTTTATVLPTITATATNTATPTNTPTSTATSTSTSTPASTPTSTPVAGTPTSTATATPTSPPVISGTVTYGNAVGAPTPRFVSNVLISGAGSPNVSTTTAFPDGTYSLSGFGAGSYTVTPAKTGAVNASITSFDAAKIAQQAAGVANPPFTANQFIVADVSGSGSVTSFDAAQVARFAAGLGTQTGASGNWIFQPVSRNYPPVTTNVSGQDYAGLLMGEVSGNWTDTGARSVSVSSIGDEPTGSTAVTAPRLVTPADNEVMIPISVEGAADKGIISYEFDLRYDPSVIEPQANPLDVVGTVSSKLSTVANPEEAGLLRVVVYGPMPIKDSGVLLNLRFTAIGAPGSVSPLTFERIMLNEGDPLTVATDGQVELVRAAPNQAEISGRLLSTVGEGVPHARVIMTDSTGKTRSVLSNGFGVYRFGGLQVGQTYTVSIDSKRLTFMPLTISVTDQLVSVDLIAEQ